MSRDPVLLLQAASTLTMVGVIWFVQIIHYPLMAGVGTAGFRDYSAGHSRRTTWVVAPLMIVEAITATILLFDRPPHVSYRAAWIGIGLVAVIWLSTMLIQVPLHRILGAGFDPHAHRRLVATNWIRTFSWTARGVLVIGWLA